MLVTRHSPFVLRAKRAPLHRRHLAFDFREALAEHRAAVASPGDRGDEALCLFLPSQKLLLKAPPLAFEVRLPLLARPHQLPQRLVLQRGVRTDLADALHDEALDLDGRDGLGRAGGVARLLRGPADVVAVEPCAALRVAVDHRGVARLAAQQALEQRAVLVPHLDSAGPRVVAEEHLRAFERRLVHDGRMLALVERALEVHLADVGDVREERMEAPLVEGPSRAALAGLLDPRLRGPAAAVRLLADRDHGALAQIHREQLAHDGGLGLVHDEAFGRSKWAGRRPSGFIALPPASSLRSCSLVKTCPASMVRHGLGQRGRLVGCAGQRESRPKPKAFAGPMPCLSRPASAAVSPTRKLPS